MNKGEKFFYLVFIVFAFFCMIYCYLYAPVSPYVLKKRVDILEKKVSKIRPNKNV